MVNIVEFWVLRKDGSVVNKVGVLAVRDGGRFIGAFMSTWTPQR
jgi:hypothetical protein